MHIQTGPDWEHYLPKPYLRLANNTSIQEVIKMLQDQDNTLQSRKNKVSEIVFRPCNHLADKRLVLSFFEDEEHGHEHWDEDIKKSLSHGIQKIISNVPHVLISTEGASRTSKLVGEILKENCNKLTFNKKDPICCAFVPWRNLKGARFFEDHQDGCVTLKKASEKSSDDDLTPNLDLYFLVEEGDLDQFATEKEFRLNLEKALINWEEFRFGVRVLIAGGISSIELVHKACCQKSVMPVIVVKGSGGLADVFATVSEYYEQTKRDDTSMNNLDIFITEALQGIFGQNVANNVNIDVVSSLKDCVKSELISIFDCTIDPKGFHFIFLTSFVRFKVRREVIADIVGEVKREMQREVQRNEMMQSGRSESNQAIDINHKVVQNRIATAYKNLFEAILSLREIDLALALGSALSELSGPVVYDLCLDGMLRIAIENSDFETFKFCLIDHGISLNHFVNRNLKAMIGKAFNENELFHSIYNVLSSNRQLDLFDRVLMLRALFGEKVNSNVLSPIQHLLLFSMETGKMELAKSLWGLDKTNALFNTILAREFLKSTIDTGVFKRADLADEVKITSEGVSFFEENALRLLSEFQKTSQATASEILREPVEFWNNKTIIDVTRSRHFRKFITHPLTQQVIEDDWNNPKLTANRVKKFLVSPKRKLYFHIMMYFIFLFLFNYSVLVASPVFAIPLKWVIFSFVLCMTIDEIKQMFRAGGPSSSVLIWASDPLNIVDALAVILYCIAFIVSFLNEEHAKTVFAVNILFWYWKLLQFLKMFSSLGPYVIMIFKMMDELKIFFVILLIFVPAHGAFIYVLLFPKSEARWEIIFSILFGPFLLIFGETGINNHKLSNTETVFGTSRIHRSAEIIAIVGTCLFLMFSNALLLNLLIAAFSNVYHDIKVISDQIWKFERYKVMEEFKRKPLLPMPFSIFEEVLSAMRVCLGERCNRKVDAADGKNGDHNFFDKYYQKEFERVCFEKMLKDNE